MRNLLWKKIYIRCGKMIRKFNKQINPEEAIQKLEQAEMKKFESVEELRKKDFDDELDTAFYFSVVFNTRVERDKWLQKHNIVLTEDFFVKAEDFIK